MKAKTSKARKRKKAAAQQDGWGGDDMDVFEEKADMLRYFASLSPEESDRLDAEADREIRRMKAAAERRAKRKRKPA